MKKEKNNNLKRYMKDILKYSPGRAAVVFIIMLILMWGTLYQPQVVKRIIDDALTQQQTGLLIGLSALYIFISFLYSCGELCRNYICSGLAMGIGAKLKGYLIKRLIGLDGNFFSDKKNGELLKILDSDIRVIQELGIDTLFEIMIEISTAIISFIILFDMQPILLLIVVVVESIAIVGQLHFTKKIALKTKEIRIIDGKCTSQLEEITANIFEVIVNKMARCLINKFIRDEKVFIKKSMNKRIYADFSGGIGNILNASITAMVYIIGGIWVINKKMSLGELIIYTQYVSMFIGPCVSLIHLNSQIQQTKVSLDKIYEFVDYQVDIQQNNKGICIKEGENIEIILEDVSFNYVEGEKVLNNFSLQLCSGKMIALVGESGSGKSTIPKLLMRFWDASSGLITINRKNLSAYNLYNLRRNITYVTQDTFLCDASIWDNIVMGNINNKKNVMKLCKELGINDFVESFEKGYDTSVGEGGTKLSGGQKQRIAIARALLYDKPIMFLDEATSALDNISQKQVLDVVKKYCSKKLLFVIAHRLSTVKDADGIYIIDKGKNVGMGTHQELIKSNKYYQEFNIGIQKTKQ